MIQLEKELEKFKPFMDINEIEAHIDEEDIKDMMDLVKSIITTKEEK